MKRKISIVLIFVLCTHFFVWSASSPVINKILYRKTLLNFYKPVLINLYLNPMQAEDVLVMFNNREVNNVNKHLKPIEGFEDPDTFLPSISFEVENFKAENILQIYVILSQGLTITAKTKIEFKKGIIIDDTKIELTPKRVFFIKAGEQRPGLSYDVEIDRSDLITRLEDTTFEGVKYFKFVPLHPGKASIKLYTFDDSVTAHEVLPDRIIMVTINQ